MDNNNNIKTSTFNYQGLTHTPIKEHYLTDPTIKKRSAVVLYQLTGISDNHIDGYNVVFLSYTNNKFNNDVMYHAHPSSSKWGKEAISCFNLERATLKFEEFKERLMNQDKELIK